VTVLSFVEMCAGWLFYWTLFGLAGGLFVVVLYAVLRAMRWVWEHRLC
jgi:hypothetical protein